MNRLLDTHIAIWARNDDPALSEKARKRIPDLDDTYFLDVLNETTAAAIEEGKRITSDNSVKGYTDMDDCKVALEI